MYGFCTPFDDISRLLTLYTVCHAASRCLWRMYAISLCLYTILLCPPPKCVNLRTAYEKDVDRSIFHSSLLTFPKFHLLRCSSVAPSLSSNAVEDLAAAVSRALTNYYCETWSHGKREGKAIKRSRKKADIKTKFPISYLLRAWRGEEKARKRSRKEADIKTKFPSLGLYLA